MTNCSRQVSRLAVADLERMYPQGWAGWAKSEQRVKHTGGEGVFNFDVSNALADLGPIGSLLCAFASLSLLVSRGTDRAWIAAVFNYALLERNYRQTGILVGVAIFETRIERAFSLRLSCLATVPC